MIVIDKFLDFFLRATRLPLEREMEFVIDLSHSIAPILAAAYEMAPPKLKEPEIQLEELQQEGFTKQSTSPWDTLFIC